MAATGVEAAARPHHQMQAGTRQHPVQQRVAKTRRGPEKTGPAACGGVHGLLQLRNVLLHARPPPQGKQRRVRMTVVFYRVAARHDFAQQIGVLAHGCANAKEAGLGLVLIQQVEHLRRDLRVWPVIKRERHPALRRRSGRQARNRLAQRRRTGKKHPGHHQCMVERHRRQAPRPQGRPPQPHQRHQSVQSQRAPHQRHRLPTPGLRGLPGMFRRRQALPALRKSCLIGGCPLKHAVRRTIRRIRRTVRCAMGSIAGRAMSHMGACMRVCRGRAHFNPLHRHAWPRPQPWLPAPEPGWRRAPPCDQWR